MKRMKSSASSSFLSFLLPFFLLLLPPHTTPLSFPTREDALSYFESQHIPSTDLELKLHFPLHTPPLGSHLFNSSYPGPTVLRQAFETHLLLDLAGQLSSSFSPSPSPSPSPSSSLLDDMASHLFVMDIREDTASSPATIFAIIRLYQSNITMPLTLSTLVYALTKQAHNQTSTWYNPAMSPILYATDFQYGLRVLPWDVGLTLRYSIESILGQGNVRDESLVFLRNYGGESACGDGGGDEANFLSSSSSFFSAAACEFERTYLADLAHAFNFSLPSSFSNLQLLSITRASLDAVLMHTRIYPDHPIAPSSSSSSSSSSSPSSFNTTSIITTLKAQVANFSSPLYLEGNVTLRVDPSAGLLLYQQQQQQQQGKPPHHRNAWMHIGRQQRSRALSEFHHYAALPTSKDAYERCQQTHRCPSAHDEGILLDFEDWREGVGGGSRDHDAYTSSPSPKKSHISPFLYPPCRLVSINKTTNASSEIWVEGLYTPHDLVLDAAMVGRQQRQMQASMKKYEKELAFWLQHVKTALLDNGLETRTRHQVRQRVVEEKIAPLNALLEKERQKQRNLTLVLPCASSFFPCRLLFNTSALTLHIFDEEGDENEAAVAMTNGYLDFSIVPLPSSSTATTTITATHEMAVFVFDALFLGPNVNVTVVGQRALVLASRTSLILNTSIIIPPGICGGFPGGYSVARRKEDRLSDSPLDLGLQDLGKIFNGDGNNTSTTNVENINGPGSSTVLVHRYTLHLLPKVTDEVQVIRTVANAGQTLKGRFSLEVAAAAGANATTTTELLPYDATAEHVQEALQQVVDMQVRVTRSARSPEGGYQWNVTFVSDVHSPSSSSSSSAVFPLLFPGANELQGNGANVEVERIRKGTLVSGSFVLSFPKHQQGIVTTTTTRPIPHAVTAEGLRKILLEDMADSLEDALVIRGQSSSDGGHLVWTLVLMTKDGLVSPPSPTSVIAQPPGEIAAGGLTSSDSLLMHAGLQVLEGHANTTDDNARRFEELTQFYKGGPFPLAFRGMGGRYHNTQKTALLPSFLVGGSGGGLGGNSPVAIGQSYRPQGRGGAGGGAFELVAAHDMVLGASTRLDVNGGEGENGSLWGGGGGSGGTLIVAASGIVKVDEGATLLAKGGKGGEADADDDVRGISGGDGEDGAVLISATAGGADDEPAKGEGLYVEDGDEVGAMGSRRALCLMDHAHVHYVLPMNSPGRISFWIKFIGERKASASVVLDTASSSYPQASSFGLYLDEETLRHGGGVLNRSSNTTSSSSPSFLNIVHHHFSTPAAAAAPAPPIWHKIDVIIDWQRQSYNLRLDNILVAYQVNTSFLPDDDGFDRMAVSGHGVLVDEIFVGPDATRNFICPPLSPPAADDTSSYYRERPSHVNHAMTHWPSHISRRYPHGNLAIEPFDGEGMEAFLEETGGDDEEGGAQDMSPLLSSTTPTTAGGMFIAGSTNHGNVDYNQRQQQPPHYWYGVSDSRETVAACSTVDFKTWRYEGTMLDATEQIKDTVYGSNPGAAIKIERPQVIYNMETRTYVMWMAISLDGVKNLTGIAISDYPNGPFIFVRSFHLWGDTDGADEAEAGEEVQGEGESVGAMKPTLDFVVLVVDNDQTTTLENENKAAATATGVAYVGWTFYQSIDYILPAAVMQPTWESVHQLPAGRNQEQQSPRRTSKTTGSSIVSSASALASTSSSMDTATVDFKANYQRAFYTAGYNNPHDIDAQRQRKEDVPFQVFCVNRITGTNRSLSDISLLLLAPALTSWCLLPIEYKVVAGASVAELVSSQYLDPAAPSLNYWRRPPSAPNVQSQPWLYNTRDSACGLGSKEGGKRCNAATTSAADNPPLPTLPDQRIGEPSSVLTRRVAYIAIARLTEDWLDTTGPPFTLIEGVLEGEAHLRSLLLGGKGAAEEADIVTMKNMAQFGRRVVVASDFQPDPTWRRQFHDYEVQYNDRASYSLACVLDEEC